jgi:hypothetical protein
VACAACAAPVRPGLAPPEPPLRISEVAAVGDARRRASTELVLSGLAAADRDLARTRFERALALDATNPWAYLALASQEIQWGDVQRGVQSLSQARVQLRSQGLDSPRVRAHFVGLSGRARERSPEVRGPAGASGSEMLSEAAHLAPQVWGDGWLSPSELR